MKAFTRYAIFTTAVTYLLIFIGGLVRVSGAGLGCPDWPRCFDRWIPPTDVSQLPAHIDPGSFNMTLAWIEYGNRLAGVLTGLFILALAVWSLRLWRKDRWITLLALDVLLLTGVNGWLGSVVVESMLKPHIVTTHMLLALLTVSLLIVIVQRAGFLANPKTEWETFYHRRTSFWLTAVLVICTVEILVGTELRSGLEVISMEHPMQSENHWIDMLGSIKYLHSTLGIVMVIAAGMMYKYGVKRSRPSRQVKSAAQAALVIILLQIVQGEVMVFLRLPGLVRLTHMWLSAILLGILILMYTRVWYHQKEIE